MQAVCSVLDDKPSTLLDDLKRAVHKEMRVEEAPGEARVPELTQNSLDKKFRYK